METTDDFDFLFKIVLIGDAAVGKTCVVHRFKTGAFIEKHNTTIGVDFAMKTIIVDGKRVKLQIWDTAGQERFRTITQSYYRSASGVVIVYDITKIETFTNVRKWLDDVEKYAGCNVVSILVGNKCDLQHLREVESSRGEEFAANCSMFRFLETSARDNTNIDALFYDLAKELKRLHSRETLLVDKENKENIGSKPVQLGYNHSVNRSFNCCSS